MAHIWVIDHVYMIQFVGLSYPELEYIIMAKHEWRQLFFHQSPSRHFPLALLGQCMQPSCKKTFWLRAVAKNQMWWPVCHPSAPHNLAIVNYMHRSYYQNGERRSRLYISIAMADALRWYSPLSFPFWWLFL